MATQTVRTGIDTWVRSSAPTERNGADAFLHLKSGAEYGYVYLANPAPAGATITSATLRLRARRSSSGSRTITAQRASAKWGGRINWNTKPGVTGTTATEAIGALSDGDLIEIDVTDHVQTMLDSKVNFGWRISTDSGTRHSVHSFQASNASYRPSLEVEWTTAPAKPTNLRPGNGAVVSDTKPVLQFDATGTVTHVNVMVSPTQDAVSPTLDSGWVATGAPQLDLADTAYGGLASGSTSWRVRYRAADGQESAWSDWTTFSRTAKGTVTITNPGADPNDYVDDTTPTVTWTFSGTQTAYQVIVRSANGATRHDSGRQSGTEVAYTLPKGVMTASTSAVYTLEIRVWDNVSGRVDGVGDPAYASATRAYTLTPDGTIAEVTSLVATQQGSTPWVDLTWDRAVAPAYFSVYRDGEVVADNLEPADLLVSGTSYAWTDYGAEPHTEHTYRVVSKIDSGGASSSSVGVTATATTKISGVWIADTTNDVFVALAGMDNGTWAMTEDAAVYSPIGSSTSVRIVSGMRGLEGSLSAVLTDGWGKTFTQMLDDLYWIKERPTGTYRLVAGDINIPAVIGGITVSPVPTTRDGQITRSVSFSFWQSGEVPFTPAI